MVCKGRSPCRNRGSVRCGRHQPQSRRGDIRWLSHWPVRRRRGGCFTVAVSNATVWEPIYGFPTQSAGTDVINVTATFSFTAAGPFQFLGIDLVDPGFDSKSGPVIAAGYRGATLIATDVFLRPGIKRVPIIRTATNLAGLNLNRLVLTTASSGAQTTLFDNVRFASAVPEPAPIALAGVVVLGGILLGRRRRV